MERAVWAVMVTALGIASFTDIRTKKIPIPTFPLAFMICLIIRLHAGTLSANYWIGFGILTVIAINLCLLVSFGGGDLLMMSAVGFATGATGAILFCVMSALISIGVFIFLLIKKQGNKRVAMAPVVLASYCATALFTCLR